MVRVKIRSGNKRIDNRDKSVLWCLILSICFMLKFGGVGTDGVLICYFIFGFLWLAGHGWYVMELFEYEIRQYRYYIRTFCILSILVSILSCFIEFKFISPLVFFTLAWGGGLSKIILKNLQD